MEKVYVVTEMFQNGLNFEFDGVLNHTATTEEEAAGIMKQAAQDAYVCFAEIYAKDDILMEIGQEQASVEVPGCDCWLCEINCCTIQL